MEGPGAPPFSALFSVASPQTSLRQMGQTRFYVAENRAVAPRVSLFVGGLPPGLSLQEYSSLLDEAVASKGAAAWAGLALWATGVGRGCGAKVGSCSCTSPGRC